MSVVTMSLIRQDSLNIFAGAVFQCVSLYLLFKELRANEHAT